MTKTHDLQFNVMLRITVHWENALLQFWARHNRAFLLSFAKLRTLLNSS